MIASAADLDAYRERDAAARNLTWRRRLAVSAQNPHRLLRFQRRLRLLEYLTNVRPGHPLVLRVRLAFLWRIHARHAERLGFTVPINTFGPGLCLVHHGTIVVNGAARVGSDARVHPSVSIGATEHGAPIVGNGCYIGPGARLIGPIELGDHVIVGANAVVLESFADHSVLAGVPARVVGRRGSRANIH